MSAGSAFFVDTNVLLYWVDPGDCDKRTRAAEWLQVLWLEGAGRVSWQVLHEFYSNAVRKMRLEASEARTVVEDLSHWGPVDSSLGLVQQAWKWIDSAQLSFWDALIVAAAERSGARYLLSEDFQAGRRYGEVEVVTPFDRAPSDFVF